MLTDLTHTYTPSEASRVLGCSKAWILRLVASGKVPAVRTGLGQLIDAAAVDELAAQRHADSPPAPVRPRPGAPPAA